MNVDRHLIIERPDGSIVLGFNEEAPAPEPQTYEVNVMKLHKWSEVFTSLFFHTSLFLAVTNFRIVDFVNIGFICTTFILVVMKTPYIKYVALCHGLISLLLFIPLTLIRMWDVAAYELGVMVLCTYLFSSSKYVTIEHLEDIPY